MIHLPITAAQIPPEWPALARHTASVTEGVELRAGPGNSIEAWSINRHRWMRVTLPGGGTEFVTAEDRDLILGRIQGTGA